MYFKSMKQHHTLVEREIFDEFFDDTDLDAIYLKGYRKKIIAGNCYLLQYSL